MYLLAVFFEASEAAIDENNQGLPSEDSRY